MSPRHFVIAIGGSAGSLEALTDFFDYTSSDHASYIIVRHMPEDYHSELKAILRRHSILNIVDVTNKVLLKTNTIYIAPADKDLVLKDGNLQLINKESMLCIDKFLQSIADQSIGKMVIAIILSGSGSDGTKGASLIKQTGGLVIAQEPTSCTFPYMPQNAIASGFVDYIATPSEMSQIIQNYIKQTELENKHSSQDSQ